VLAAVPRKLLCACLHAKLQKSVISMQGHCNAISSVQATPDRSLLITADAGPQASLLVFWDPATGQPVTTVQQPHAAGVVSMAVSADGCLLATLSAPAQDSQEHQQEVSPAAG
jgi:WD40 repeat protein